MSGFMVLQVWQETGLEGECLVDDGSGWYPESHVEADPESYRLSGDKQELWWAEYSAPGYMDRTDSVCASTPWGAALAAFELYGDFESREERSELASMFWQLRREGFKVERVNI